MKKIAVVINALSWVFSQNGGGSTVVKNFILTLNKMPEIELHVYSCCSVEENPLNLNVKFIERQADNKEFLESLKKNIEYENFDEIFSFDLPVIYKNIFLQTHSFKFRANQNCFLIKLFKYFFNRKKFKEQNQFFKIIEHDTKIFAVSEIIKNDYIKNLKLPEDKIEMLHLACNQTYEQCPEIIKKEKITFGMIGNNSLNKSVHFLLFSFGIVKILGYDFDLKLVLKNNKVDILMKILINFFGMKKNIEIMKINNKIEQFYDVIDCLILPSIYEAFGLVALEAMSFAKTVIVNETAGVAEIIDEKIGFKFNRRKLETFLKTLVQVINLYNNEFEKFTNMSKSAFFHSKKYTWENFVLNIFNKLGY